MTTTSKHPLRSVSRQSWAALFAVWMSTFLVSYDYTAINVALPTLATKFGVGTGGVSWASLSYMLVMVSLTLSAGPAIVRFGYARVLSISLAIFCAASLAAALSDNLYVLVAMRGLQGIGASVMFVIGSPVIKKSFPPEAQAMAFSIFASGATMGVALGPPLGGTLTVHFGWQAVFLANVPLVAIALLFLPAVAGVERASRERGATPPPLPPAINMVTPALCLGAFIIALNQGTETGWLTPPIVGAFALSAGLALIFVLIERRAKHPLINRNLLYIRSLVVSASASFLGLTVIGGLVFLLPFYFEWLWKFPTDTVGHILVAQPVATIIVSIAAGLVLGGLTRSVVARLGIVILSAGVALIALGAPGDTVFIPILALILVGIGTGLFSPSTMQIGLEMVPDALLAQAAAFVVTVRVVAQMLGVVVFETVFSTLFPLADDATRAAAATGTSLEHMAHAFGLVFGAAALIAALGLIPTFFLSARTPTSTGRKP